MSVFEISLILDNEGGFMPDEAVAWFCGARGTFGSGGVAQAALSRDRLAKIIEEAWRDGHSQYLYADGGLSWEEKSGVYIEALDDALTTKPPAAPVEVMEGCICQDRHRRGYCTEPGCPYSISSTNCGSGK